MKLSGLKLLLCCPTYGPTDPLPQSQLRVAVMNTAANGVEWQGEVSPDKLGFSYARNVAAQSLMDMPEANGLMWVDSDIHQQPWQMTALLESALHYGATFVTGVYHQRKPPHDPVFYKYNKHRDRFNAVRSYEPNAFAPTDACGFGFVYTHRSVIEAVAKSKLFDRKKGWFPDQRYDDGFGEDIAFGRLAMFAGQQLYVNTGVIVGHAGDPAVYYPKDQIVEGRADVAGPEGSWGIE